MANVLSVSCELVEYFMDLFLEYDKSTTVILLKYPFGILTTNSWPILCNRFKHG